MATLAPPPPRCSRWVAKALRRPLSTTAFISSAPTNVFSLPAPSVRSVGWRSQSRREALAVVREKSRRGQWQLQVVFQLCVVRAKASAVVAVEVAWRRRPSRESLTRRLRGDVHAVLVTVTTRSRTRTATRATVAVVAVRNRRVKDREMSVCTLKRSGVFSVMHL